MKYFLGILATLLTIAAATLGILALWGINPFSPELIGKFLLTLLIALVAFALLALYINAFFKKEKYNKKGNKAHLMNK